MKLFGERVNTVMYDWVDTVAKRFVRLFGCPWVRAWVVCECGKDIRVYINEDEVLNTSPVQTCDCGAELVITVGKRPVIGVPL